MPAPIGHSDLSTFMGSWPAVPEFVSGTPTFDTRVLDRTAVILGVKRETAAGYNVNGKSMFIWVDGVQKSISFVGTDPFTLQEVVTNINTDAALTIAFPDNGFLRLEGILSGEAGSLRLETDTDPDVFFELGLFSETTATGGSLRQTQHFDPDRQVALPHQVAMGDGESIRADVINRALYQLAANTERNEGILSRKRIAAQNTLTVFPYLTTGTPTEEGIQFAGSTQVFNGSATIPNSDALQSLFAVLDEDGREYVKKVSTVLSSLNASFTNDGIVQRCIDDDAGAFVGTDEKNEIYIVSTNVALPVALRGVPMKVLEVEGANTAVIAPIEPDGTVTLFATGILGSVERTQVDARRCLVDEIRVSQGGARVEGILTTKEASIAVTRVDKNNRIVVSGATFETNLVQVGDLVVWAGFVDTNPYTNNGNYRVSQVIDEETIEVVAEDWGPVYLNPNLVSGAGTITVSTDGSFFTDPFIHFLPEASGGAVPDGENIQLLYLGMTTLRDATDDPTALNGGGVRYHQEADDYVQETLLAIIGPSATSVTEYLHDDARNNMEDLDYRLNFEHYESDASNVGGGSSRKGRHRDIRPDTIDMFSEVPGMTATIRSATADAATVEKVQVLDSASNQTFSIRSDGSVEITNTLGDSFLNVVSSRAAANTALVSAQALLGDNGVAAVEARGSNTALGNAAIFRWVGDASGGTPSIWEAIADGGAQQWKLNLVDDGSGGSFEGIFLVDAFGNVSVGTNAIPGVARMVVGHPAALTVGTDAFKAIGMNHSGFAGIAGTGVVGTGGDSTNVTDGDGGDGGLFTGGAASGTDVDRIAGVGLRVFGGFPGDNGHGLVVTAGANGFGIAAVGGAGAGQVGIWGQSKHAGGAGVEGVGFESGDGVLGTADEDDGVGVKGVGGSIVTSGGGAGVWGIGPNTKDCYGVVAQSDSTAGLRSALRIVPQDGSSNMNAQEGDMFSNSVTSIPEMYNGAEWRQFRMQQGSLSGPGPTLDQVTSTAGATPFATTYRIAANTLEVGDSIRIRAVGSINTIGETTDTVSFTITAGGTLVGRAATSASATPANQDVFFIDCTLVIRALGIAATQGRSSRGNLSALPIYFDGGVFTMNTETFTDIEVICNFNVAGSNQATLHVLTVDVIGS